MILKVPRIFFVSSRSAWTPTPVEYRQGQWINNVREYFYYLDHNGQLFLDDARMKNFTSCFKDKRFLNFFFWRLKFTELDRYKEHFPYMSPCGKECNFIRCDDRPIVFTSLDEDEDVFLYNCSTKSVPFQPSKLCMFPNGRLYHPSNFDNYGLVKSKLADELYPKFEFDEKGLPVYFHWKNEKVKLTNELLQYAKDNKVK
ncbi:hypothetical protein FO519_008239 [Halicephalobus sp. NKZ332]|nr:hypothetical protein FO519_008239 [Halicephalobus sp. NKZ332]